MAVARAQRIRRASVNVVDAQRGVARGGDVLLVGSDLQLVHLRVRVLHRLVAHPGGRLPQTDRVVIAGRPEEDTAHPSPVLSVGRARNLLAEPWPKLVSQREDAPPARARRFTDALTPPRKFAICMWKYIKFGEGSRFHKTRRQHASSRAFKFEPTHA